MADTRLLRLLSSLDVQFDAAVAREEDVAASDLALSLRQGLSLRDVLRKGAWLARLDGAERPVALVGRDFVACGGPDTILIPNRNLLAARTDTGVEPRISSVSLVETLRALCRSGAEVEVSCRHTAFSHTASSGRLIQVGPDHLALSTISGVVFMALEAVDLIRMAEAIQGEEAGGVR